MARDLMFMPIKASGRITPAQPIAPKALEAEAAIKILADLFNRTKSADRIDEGIQNGTYKGVPAPRRCSGRVSEGGVCGLPLKNDEGAACAFHKAVQNFAALEVTGDDIYRGSPVLARLAALKPAG